MSQAQIGNLNVRLAADTAQFQAGLNEARASLAGITGSLKTFAASAGALTVFTSAMNSLRNVADMGDVAESIGLTAEQLQVFNKMALASGTGTDIMARGLQSIAEQSTSANSALSKLFTANGLVTAGKTMNEIMLDFMTLLQNAKSPAEQLAIATGVLGDRVGRQLVESLRTGASGWNQAFNSMVEDGYYLSNEQVKAAQEIETKYNEVIANITAAWQSMVVTIAQGLNALVDPDMGGPANKFRFNYGLGAAKGVPVVPPGSTPGAGGGKGDLPGNINSQTHLLNKPTANPFNGIKITPPGKGGGAEKEWWEIAPPSTIEDIYGAGKAVTALKESLAATVAPMSAVAEGLTRMGDTISASLENSIYGLITGTMSVKEAFANMAEGIISSLAQIAAELAASAILRALLGGLSGGAGMLTGGAGISIGGMMFGGVRAAGGPVMSGRSYLVGEEGPELFTPGLSGGITPNHALGGAAPITVNITNNSPANVSTSRGPNGSLDVLIEEKVANAMARGGGKIDAALQRGYGLRRAGR